MLPLQERLPTKEDVVAAQAVLRGRVIETPLLRVPALDRLSGAELFLKAENLQRIGAFKARGALFAVLSLAPEARARGLITYSSGNHGQAVALAARETGTRAVITMPTDAPAIKVESIRELGAEVVFAGETSATRKQLALEIAAARQLTVIPPFDDSHVIAGQGTATLELLEQARGMGAELDLVLVPVGGGGLLAGACLAVETVRGCSVIAVEPVAASAFAASFAKGELVDVQPGATIADGLKPVRIGEKNFAVSRDRVAQSLTVTDQQLGRALVSLLLHGKVLVEPSGAAALAAALDGGFAGKRLGVLLSGGNVAPERLRELLARHAD